MRALKTQIGTGLGNPGGPTRSDTVRLVEASEAQLVDLLKRGYVLDRQEIVPSTEKVVDTDYSFGAMARNKIDDITPDDILTAIANKPELLASITINLNPVDMLSMFYLKGDELDRLITIVETTLDDVLATEPFNLTDAGLVDDRPTQHRVDEIERGLRELRSHRDRYQAFEVDGDFSNTSLVITNEDQRINFLNTFRMGQPEKTWKAIDRIVGGFAKMAFDAAQTRNAIEKGRLDYEENAMMPQLRKGSQSAPLIAMMEGMEARENHMEDRGVNQLRILKDANPDVDIDPDFIESQYAEGYDRAIMEQVEESFTLQNLRSDFSNLASGIWNSITDDTEYEEVDMGDKGVQRKITKKRSTERRGNTASERGGVRAIRGFYPYAKRVEEIRNIEGYRDDTDYREDLEDGFYLDRESEGTGAVRRDDLDKTLFHEEVFPGRKLTLWNEEEKDMVSVYVYDKPDMMKKAGISFRDGVAYSLRSGIDPQKIIDGYDRRMSGGSSSSQVTYDQEIEPRTQQQAETRAPQPNRGNTPPVPQRPPGLTPIKKKQAGPIAMTESRGLMKPKTSMPRGQKQSYGMRMANPTKFQGGQLEQTKFVGGKEQKMTIEEAAHHVYKRGKRRFNNNPEIGLREATREAINLGKKGLMNVDLSDAKDYPDNFLSISL